MMRTLISPADMLRCEKAHFESSGIPSIEYMERAARALHDAIIARYPSAATAYIACGPGGNGGDGYACARMLCQSGIQVTVFSAAPAKAPDAVENEKRAKAAGVRVLAAAEANACPPPALWVDAVYGTGLNRAPQGDSEILIRRINADRSAGAKVISADIPSGLNGLTGQRYEPCVQADMTVAFEMAKYGHYLSDGLDVCGRMHIAPIGFPKEAFASDLLRLFEPCDLRAHFTPRPRNIYKNKCGHLLIVAGSTGMAGAAAMCANAALRSGAGLVSIAAPEDIVPILQILAPCAMCIPLAQERGMIAPSAKAALESAFRQKTAVAAGCGLGAGIPDVIVKTILDSPLPVVIDADALNCISANPGLKKHLKPRHILTPHPGEAARLLGAPLTGDCVEDARSLAETGACIVLKGASRVICGGGRLFLSASGACSMARGGSGDVLTGITGALLCENSSRTPAETAAAACEIHGLCGMRSFEVYGPRAANAADLIEFLPEVFQTYVD